MHPDSSMCRGHKQVCESKGDGMLQILRMLADPNSLLPWDEGRISEADKAKLGCFLKPIQNVLQRDPAQRPTVRQFRLQLNSFVTH